MRFSKKFKRIGRVLRSNCLLHDVIDIKMMEMNGLGRRITHLFDDLRNKDIGSSRGKLNIEKSGIIISSHEHKENMQFLTHKSKELIKCSPLNNINNNNNNNNNSNNPLKVKACRLAAGLIFTCPKTCESLCILYEDLSVISTMIPPNIVGFLAQG